jgi:hypothetical protein
VGSQYEWVGAKGVPSWFGAENVTAVSAAARYRRPGVNLPSLLGCRPTNGATAHRRMICDTHHTSTGDYLLGERVDVADAEFAELFDESRATQVQQPRGLRDGAVGALEGLLNQATLDGQEVLA